MATTIIENQGGAPMYYKGAYEVYQSMLTDAAYASKINEILFFVTEGAHAGEIYLGGRLLDGRIAADVACKATIGKVAAGSKIPAGTTMEALVNTLFNFEAPSFSALSMGINYGDFSTVYGSDTVIYCSGTAVSLVTVGYTVDNFGSATGVKITTPNGATTNVSQASGTYPFSINLPRLTKGYAQVKLTGMTTLGASMSGRTMTLRWVLPFYQFKATSTSAITTAMLTAANMAGTKYYAGGSITGAANVSLGVGECYCFAVPSYVTATELGTTGDYTFGTQAKGSNISVLGSTLSHAYDGATANAYKVYYVQASSAVSGVQYKMVFTVA